MIELKSDGATREECLDVYEKGEGRGGGEQKQEQTGMYGG